MSGVCGCCRSHGFRYFCFIRRKLSCWFEAVWHFMAAFQDNWKEIKHFFQEWNAFISNLTRFLFLFLIASIAEVLWHVHRIKINICINYLLIKLYLYAIRNHIILWVNWHLLNYSRSDLSCLLDFLFGLSAFFPHINNIADFWP